MNPTADELVTILKKYSVEEVLLPLLFQLIVIILSARVLATLARKIGQPGVVGEIAAGLILGPSVFGRLWSVGFQGIFRVTLHDLPAAFSQTFLDRKSTRLNSSHRT